MVSYEPKIAEGKIRHYAYDPHLSPQLVWPESQDHIYCLKKKRPRNEVGASS